MARRKQIPKLPGGATGYVVRRAEELGGFAGEGGA